MKLQFPIIGALCATFCVSAMAAEGKWTEGYGQGNLEYFIDQKGIRLYIGCPTEEGSVNEPSSVALIQTRNDKQIQPFTIQAGGHTFQGPFTTGSRVDESNFVALLDGLRKTDAIVKAGNQTLTFPKSNAAKVIPVDKKLRCNMR